MSSYTALGRRRHKASRSSARRARQRVWRERRSRARRSSRKSRERMGNNQRKSYLGDAVYAAVDEWGRLVLTTEDGTEAYNTIVLEPEVLDALEHYIASWK